MLSEAPEASTSTWEYFYLSIQLEACSGSTRQNALKPYGDSTRSRWSEWLHSKAWIQLTGTLSRTQADPTAEPGSDRKVVTTSLP
jgi:hypothetical protein